MSTKSNKIITNNLTNYLTNYVRLFFCVASICTAYICNQRSKKHNKYLTWLEIGLAFKCRELQWTLFLNIF